MHTKSLKFSILRVPVENGASQDPKKTITKSPRRKSEISQKVAKQVGEIINFARFLCTQESFGHIKKNFTPLPHAHSHIPPPTLCNCDWLRSTKSAVFLDFFDFCLFADPVWRVVYEEKG